MLGMTDTMKAVAAFRGRMVDKPVGKWTDGEWREFDVLSRAALPDMEAQVRKFMELAASLQDSVDKVKATMAERAEL